MRAGLVLALLGIVLAAALGFAAHVVAQDTIGLPAVALEGGAPRPPEEARKTATKPTTTQETQTETEPRTSTDDHGGTTRAPEPGDDSGGHGRNRGHGGDD